MKKRSEIPKKKSPLREKTIGLGDGSARKSYYPQLLEQLKQLEDATKKAEESENKFRTLFERGATQKSNNIKKNGSNLKNCWTRASHVYNIQGHGLAVKNTRALGDRGGGE